MAQTVSAQARSEFGLIIQPAIVRYNNLLPGKRIQGEVTISHSFNENVTLKIEAFSQDLTQKNGEPIFIDLSNNDYRYSLRKWIEIDSPNFDLKQGEKKTIKYAINVPNNPEAGGRYAAVLFKVVGISPEREQGNVALIQTIGQVVIGRVPGDVKENSELLNFTTDKPVYFSFPFEEVKFNIEVKNTGNVDEVIGGNIFTHTGDITKPTATLKVNPGASAILPDNTRTYVELWKTEGGIIVFKDNQMRINIDYFRVGKQKATLKMFHHVNNREILSERVVEFWLLPWWLFLIILIGILFITTKIYGKTKKQHKK